MDKITEAVEKAAAAKAWLAARQAKRNEAEAKVLAVLNTLRDIRDDLKADVKAAEQEQSDLDGFFIDLMRYVESQPESPEQDATLSALEDISHYGQSVLDGTNTDSVVEMLKNAIEAVDEIEFYNYYRSEVRSCDSLDNALLRLPSND